MVSRKSLKSAKPVWYCVPQHFGTVAALAQSGVNLHYVVETMQIANIWRMLGNPKFRNEYAYLLVSFNAETRTLQEVYAVKTGLPGEKKPKKMMNVPAFSGHVDKIVFGWTTSAIAKRLKEGSNDGNIPESGGMSPF